MAGMTAFGIGASLLAPRAGGLWTPKAQRLTVGRDIAPISATALVGERRDIVVAGADDMRFTATEVFGLARSVAQSGSQVKHFRAVKTQSISFSSQAEASGDPEGTRRSNLEEVRASASLMETKDRLVTFSGGTLNVWRKEADGTASLMAEHRVTDDTRLVWDNNGNPEILSGAAAHTNGKLAAETDKEVLIRMSDVVVEAGTTTTILNLSQRAGTFSGGQNVTYLGNYDGSAITGAKGETTYAGYFANASIESTGGKGVFSGVFENMRINAGDEADVFSGYFSATAVRGGNGKNVFNGMFLNNSALVGGKDADGFSGRFIDSQASGGDGDNSFGSTVSLAAMRRVVTDTGSVYDALEADFVNTSVTGGEGRDTFRGVTAGGSINLSEGDDQADGVFTETRLATGAGNDTVTALYAMMSTFDAGGGNDAVDLATAFASRVSTGQGTSAVTLGRNREDSGEVPGSTWQTADEYLRRATPKAFGELGGNSVDAAAGENVVTVNTGTGTQTIRTGETSPTPAASAQQQATEPAEQPTEADTVEAPIPSPADANSIALAWAIDAGNTNLSLITGNSGSLFTEAAPSGPGASPVLPVPGKRYARLTGQGQETGSIGATVSTGAGEDIRIRTYDSGALLVKAAVSGIRRITSRSAGAGRYEWVQSLA